MCYASHSYVIHGSYKATVQTSIFEVSLALLIVYTVFVVQVVEMRYLSKADIIM